MTKLGRKLDKFLDDMVNIFKCKHKYFEDIEIDYCQFKGSIKRTVCVNCRKVKDEI